jgi:hypothetical protein
MAGALDADSRELASENPADILAEFRRLHIIPSGDKGADPAQQ